MLLLLYSLVLQLLLLLLLYLSLRGRGEVLTDGVDVLDVLVPLGVPLLRDGQSRRGLRRPREGGTWRGGEGRLGPRRSPACRQQRGRRRRKVRVVGDGRRRGREVVETSVQLRVLVPAAAAWIRSGIILRRRRLDKCILR